MHFTIMYKIRSLHKIPSKMFDAVLSSFNELHNLFHSDYANITLVDGNHFLAVESGNHKKTACKMPSV